MGISFTAATLLSILLLAVFLVVGILLMAFCDRDSRGFFVGFILLFIFVMAFFDYPFSMARYGCFPVAGKHHYYN